MDAAALCLFSRRNNDPAWFITNNDHWWHFLTAGARFSNQAESRGLWGSAETRKGAHMQHQQVPIYDKHALFSRHRSVTFTFSSQRDRASRSPDWCLARESRSTIFHVISNTLDGALIQHYNAVVQWIWSHHFVPLDAQEPRPKPNCRKCSNPPMRKIPMMHTMKVHDNYCWEWHRYNMFVYSLMPSVKILKNIHYYKLITFWIAYGIIQRFNFKLTLQTLNKILEKLEKSSRFIN